jgi:hypothetical protein
MATTGGPTVVLTFAGDSGPLDRTVKQVTASTSALGRSLGALASGASAVQAVGGLAGALTQLAPAALLLPGALLAGAGAMATFKVATAGVGEAISAGLSGDLAAFAEATKGLAPAAAETARAFAGFKPQVDALKASVQGAFFDGFATEVRTLGGQLLPTLQTGMTSIAGGFNDIGVSALQAAQAPFFGPDIADILGNTASMLGNMRTAVGDALQGFVGLGAVGSSYLPALGTAISNVADRFNAWVQSGVESGAITDMIDRALQGFRDLGAIVVNLGSTVGSVFTGLGGSTESFLGPLRDATAQLATFMASASAQEALRALGEAMRAAGTVLHEVFLAGLQALAPVVATLAPVVTGVATTLSGWSEVLGPLAVGIIGLTLAIKGIVAGVALYNGIMKTVQALTTAWTGVQWLLNAALTANPIGLVVIAIAALVAAIVLAWQNSETFRTIVLGAWEGVKTGIGAAVEWIKGAIAWFGQLPGLVGGWFGGMRDAAVARATDLVNWVAGLPGRFGNIGNLLLDSGRALIDGFRRGLSNAWDGLVSWFQGQLAWFRGLWPFSPAKWGPFSGRGYVTYSGEAMVGDFADSLRSGIPEVGRAGNALMGAAAAGSSMSSMALRSPAAPAASGGAATVTFGGNVDSAFATAFMRLVRTGQIQIG